MANMKKIFDERTKHRLIGLIVVLALMVIILPAMMRESNTNFDEFTSYKVPKKPPLPQVSVLDKKAIFQTVNVAKLTIPKTKPVVLEIAQAQPLHQPVTQDQIVQAASTAIQKQQTLEAKKMRFNEVFTVQLASFNQEVNAQTLIQKLRSQGFAASQQKVKSSQGVVYQVIVGKMKHRNQAVDLQKKLVDNTQLNGLIIKTKVT